MFCVTNPICGNVLRHEPHLWKCSASRTPFDSIHSTLFTRFTLFTLSMSHVTHMNESCHTYKCLFTRFTLFTWSTSLYPVYSLDSLSSYEWVMAHIWMSHVTHMNGSIHSLHFIHFTLSSLFTLRLLNGVRNTEHLPFRLRFVIRAFFLHESGNVLRHEPHLSPAPDSVTYK